MNCVTSNLDELSAEIWRTLEEAPLNATNPLRTPAFGTASSDGCALRTVVLRQAAAIERALVCYSDFRAPKISHIQMNPRVQWLFCDAEQRIQIIARASAAIHHLDVVARAAWESTAFEHRLNYASAFAPGVEISAPDSALPHSWRERQPTPKELEHAFASFAVIVTTVEHLDFLHLRPPGNRRVGFAWNGSSFQGSWLAP